MKKLKYLIGIMLISVSLIGCSSSTQSIVDNTTTETETKVDNSEFDKVFDEFTSLTENIREEKDDDVKDLTVQTNTNKNNVENSTFLNVSNYTDADLGLIVDFIDVGQGDAIFIQSNNEYMLIDAGDTYTSEKVLEYVSSKTSTLKYLIPTHPHKDHIGGMKDILSNILVDTIIMSDVEEVETKVYSEMVNLINERELNVVEPIVGEEYTLGDAKFMILAPNSNVYEDINNYSIVIRLTYGEKSFLLTGDAENLSENEIMETGFDISSDVLKIGHHGSKYSSSSKFLDTVRPTIAVVSVGENNSYGHPHDDLLSKLNSREILTYRTDINGSISIGTDGENLYAITEKTSNIAPIETEEVIEEESEEESFIYPEDSETYIVYTTRDNKYHNEGCSELEKVNNQVTLAVAQKMGYTPCEKCFLTQNN